MLVLLLTAAAGDIAAQQTRPERGGEGRPRGGARTAQERQALERRFEARLAEVVQRELRTTPEQTQRLAAVNRGFERQRRPLFQREVALRRELRRQLSNDGSADQRRVEAAMRELFQLQRRRIDLIEAEQRALAEFLTPVQRARYLALQENLRHRVEQRGREGRARASGAVRTPPRRP